MRSKGQGLLLGIIAGLMVLSPRTISAGENQQKPDSATPEYAQLKSLVGRWEGTVSEMGSQTTQPTSVQYHLTSGGSALVETLFSGTDHEMVSVYFEQNGKPAMTHYCMLGNHPQLNLVSSAAGRLDFSLGQPSGIAENERHMHELVITWKDADHITQEWTSYNQGKPEGKTTIDLSRAPVVKS